ncbi:hypothetical protein MyChFU_22480 [Mycobacterium intracellulare subsp. chimaera]
MVRPDSTDSYTAAVMLNSADTESQLPAAANNEPDPGPAYIRPEFTSGGRNPKSIVLQRYQLRTAALPAVRHPAAGGRGITVSRTP